jgi:hypothetical protein
LNSAGDPKPRFNLVAQSTAYGVALVLRVRKVATGWNSSRIFAEKKSAADREPCVAQGVGVTQHAREAAPVGQLNLGFRAIDDGVAEGDWEADSRVLNLVIVSVVADVATKIICVSLM